MVFQVDEPLIFPNPELAEPDGLLAVGGDLSIERLQLAYRSGIFPWYSDETPILWYAPHERFVLYPDELIISGSMKRFLRKQPFTITVDTCFEKVIEACSAVEREGQDGTWITEDMKNAYIKLHREGYARSIEVWQQDQLVGGVYGVPIGKLFCGESMFSKVSNASKTALIYLCQSGLYNLIDCQVYTDHLASMGARMISQKDYMGLLQKNGG
jgi:leucyl/phenylalanyl-tRNA---protein transferase